MEGVGWREALQAANDFIPMRGGDTGALAVEQLKCFSASCQWPQESYLFPCEDMPSGGGRPGRLVLGLVRRS